jgi:hypothetical protein
MEKKLEFSAAADYENEALAIEAPESQRTPILLAKLLKLESLPAATWNLHPKREIVSIHASCLAPIRKKIGARSGLIEPCLP